MYIYLAPPPPGYVCTDTILTTELFRSAAVAPSPSPPHVMRPKAEWRWPFVGLADRAFVRRHPIHFRFRMDRCAIQT